MNLEFEPVDFDAIRATVTSHLNSLPQRIDSFLEDHILASTHYLIDVDGEDAGYVSVHGGKLITQFALAPQFRQLGQSCFARVKQLEAVQSAFVPTCDEFYLALGLDEYRQLTKQAYFFAHGSLVPISARFTSRLARIDEVEEIARESGDFFDPIHHSIASGSLFVTTRDGEAVGYGVMEQSTIYDRVASIGMFTIERHRGIGAGTATIAGLIREAKSRGLEPIAGCWYLNHPSKKTLERAGMYSPTRLLKIDF